MTEQSKWVSEDINQSILQGIRQAQINIEQQHAGWIDDEPSRFHVRFMALLLAAYRTLMELMPREVALALLTDATLEPNRTAIQEGVKAALDSAPDPMLMLVDVA